MRENELKLPEPVPSLQSADAFVEQYGAIYEHSPWVALRTWERGLTSSADTVEGLAVEMAKTLASASRDEQLTLILAHPDLAGRAAKQGELTQDSTDEQSSAGLDQCTSEELQRFHTLNNSYKNKFQFPFIMAVRGANRFLILEAFETRIENDKETEFGRALDEINKIALLRLQAMSEV